jgi:hypothetical protein
VGARHRVGDGAAGGAGQGTRWGHLVVDPRQLGRQTGDGDDGGTGPEPVAAEADIELVGLVEVDQGEQGTDVLDGARAGKHRTAPDHVKFRAESTVITLDVGNVLILHYHQACTMRRRDARAVPGKLDESAPDRSPRPVFAQAPGP